MLPRVPLIVAPTPLHRLDRASQALGIDLWIKRDDLTGFAMGGNKGRKLEYLMAEALASGAEIVVSCGSVQSNFIRQLGAACRILGLRCAAAAMELPYEPDFGKPTGYGPKAVRGGNETLDYMLGVELNIVPDGSWEDLFSAAEALALKHEATGRKVYRIPIGGSSPQGAFAFYQAGLESRQQAEFETVVCPSSSGSTHAGLAYAFATTPTQVIGISCDPEPDNLTDLVQLAEGLDQITGFQQGMTIADFDLRYEFVGDGYGVASEGSVNAIKWLLDHEGIFLDPIYSGKAFDGLLNLVQSGELSGRVLFWHTGGMPTLFATPR